MSTRELIRIVNGVETPGQGRWIIAAGLPVLAWTGLGRRRSSIVGHTAGGALTVHDTGALALDVELDLRPPRDPAATRRIAYRGRVLGGVRGGGESARWPIIGSLAVGDPAEIDAVEIDAVEIDAALPSSVRYHGVFRRGAGAIAWLHWRLRLHPDRLTGDDQMAPGRRVRSSRRMLELSADLDVAAPAELLAN